ncbi:MAG: hypothetical protein ACYC8U_15120 [Thermoleophilia bacterium]
MSAGQHRPGERGLRELMLATTLSLFAIVAFALSACGEAKEPLQGYPASISANDVVGFTVVLADRVDIEKPGPLPESDVLAQFLDAYSRSPVNEFVPTSGDLVAVVIWRTDGEVTEVLAGPGYPGSHVLIRHTDATRDISRRHQVSSAGLVDLIKGLARERLSVAEKQQLDPEGMWLGE